MSNKFYSPLRYPGGKSRLAKFISNICIDNDIDGHYVEPYAGGAAVALYLLLEGKVERITINDFDRAIYAFWHSVLYETDNLCVLIEQQAINTETWDACRKILRYKDEESDLLKLGYATLFLNRTSFSGALNAGMIGGKSQDGKYKMDCRFNKKTVISRVKQIASRKDDITITNLDALELINDLQEDSNTLFYFDPPYYNKGPSLYLNYYRHDDHEQVSRAIKGIKHAKWIVSYDNTPQINELYEGLPSIEYSLSHTVNGAKQGLESIFLNPKLVVDLKKHPVTDYT